MSDSRFDAGAHDVLMYCTSALINIVAMTFRMLWYLVSGNLHLLYTTVRAAHPTTVYSSTSHAPTVTTYYSIIYLYGILLLYYYSSTSQQQQQAYSIV